jgi:hypothetical protein
MNKNENDILTRKFRERLENYEFPVSEKVWENIEKDLSSVRKPVVRLIWRRVAAVAAVLLALLGMEWYFSLQTVRRPMLETVRYPALDARATVNHSSFNREIAGQARNDKVETIIVASTQGSNDKVEENIVAEPQSRKDKVPADVVISPAQTPVNRINTSRRNARRPLTLALAYGNQGRSPASQDMREWYPNTVFPTANRVLYDAPPPNNLSATDVHHDMPLAVSLSVRKYFTPNWAFESGLTYTGLKSRETRHFPNGNAFSKDIRLHYLGIPLKIVYSFYTNNRLSLYASAGGMVEKCVSGREYAGNTTTKLDIPELQYSLTGNIGLNYRLFDTFSLFVEPGAGYYFDDHSDIRTIRKDKPWNIGVQVGFRLSY